MKPKYYRLLFKNRLKYNFIRELVEDIDDEACIIKKFTEFDNYTIAQMKLYLKKRKQPHALKKDVIRSALKTYYGWIYADTLYYNNYSNLKDTVSTIIHEYVHWRRKEECLYKYRSHYDIFIEEFFAELVSKYYINALVKNGKTVSANRIIKAVIRNYALNIDKNKAIKLAIHKLNEITHYFD
jgi:hypothetical protein